MLAKVENSWHPIQVESVHGHHCVVSGTRCLGTHVLRVYVDASEYFPSQGAAVTLQGRLGLAHHEECHLWHSELIDSSDDSELELTVAEEEWAMLNTNQVLKPGQGSSQPHSVEPRPGKSRALAAEPRPGTSKCQGLNRDLAYGASPESLLLK